MKLKSKLYLAVILNQLLFASMATAASGVRGGGHVIDYGDRLELLDIITDAKCDWYPGDTVRETVPYVDEMLERISKLDWYLSLELRREIDFLSWCFTGKLYNLPSADNNPDSFVRGDDLRTQQAAIRYEGSVYLDRRIFDRLDAKSKTYLIFHEAIHSYLPMELEDRIFKHHTIVSTLRKVDLVQLTDERRLTLNLAQSGMDFAHDTSKLDDYREELSFILENSKNQREIFLEHESPENLLLEEYDHLRPYLAPWDQMTLDFGHRRFIEIIKDILSDGDPKELEILLQRQKFSRFSPVAVAIEMTDHLGPKLREEIFSTKRAQSLMKGAKDFLSSMKIQLVGARIVASEAIVRLSTMGYSGRPVNLTSLSVPNLFEPHKHHLPQELRSLAVYMTLLADRGNGEEFEVFIKEYSALKSSLSLNFLFTSLENLEAPMAREKRHGQLALIKIKEFMLEQLKHEVRQHGGSNFELVIKFLEEI